MANDMSTFSMQSKHSLAHDLLKDPSTFNDDLLSNNFSSIRLDTYDQVPEISQEHSFVKGYDVERKTSVSLM